MQFVPVVKRHLETLLFRVQVMLTNSSSSDEFWMGDLKNKDLQGKELQSQVLYLWIERARASDF